MDKTAAPEEGTTTVDVVEITMQIPKEAANLIPGAGVVTINEAAGDAGITVAGETRIDAGLATKTQKSKMQMLQSQLKAKNRIRGGPEPTSSRGTNDHDNLSKWFA